MAEDQGGQKRDMFQTAPWLKLFGAFKVALDPKKLLLAGAGILVMAFGWWLLAVFFSLFRSERPQFSDYVAKDHGLEEKREDFKNFKEARRRWNLFYEMAGVAPASIKDAKRKDAADLAGSYEEYQELEKLVSILGRNKMPIVVKVDKAPVKDKEGVPEVWLGSIEIGGTSFPFTTANAPQFDPKQNLVMGNVQVINEKAKLVAVAGITVTLMDAKDVASLLGKIGQSLSQLQQEAGADATKKELLTKASLIISNEAPILPFGRLRTWPWFEDRGPNPYLLVTGNAKSADGTRSVPWQRGQFFSWLMGDQAPVLLEPLVKFLGPVTYLFNPAAGGWNRIYLFLIILWTLATWGLFGGAITRMAAVQVARHNEKIGMMEAVRFARARYQSFFSAPLFPLIFMAVITFFLVIYGLVEGYTWIFGDIIVAGLMWPLVLIAGLVMAVVLVGLVGWPLMYATISTEGSDSFDALSRSYSYVYQAPWNYLWYSFVALLYGAVLVFFVGFMGSLLVYLGKWGVTQAPYTQSREPSYLFVNAPTSFGWRDLLLYKSREAEMQPVVRPNGSVAKSYGLNKKYMDEISWNNRFGGFLVCIWIYLLFLLIVGFGYSYFWTAATIIYLLMRRKVDDTEMDEIHLEEEEEEPFGEAPPIAGAPAAKPPSGVTMVESPTLRAPASELPTPPSEGNPPAGEPPH